MSSPAPAISRDLLEYLQRVFPNKLPEDPICSDYLAVQIGQQKVIRHLQAQFAVQSRTVLST